MLHGRFQKRRIAFRVEHELVVSQIARRQYQYRDNEVVELTSGDMSDGLAAIDIRFFFQALRCQLESPGKDQCQGKPDQHEDRHQGHRPIGKLQNRKGRGRDLDQKPSRDRIGNRYPNDVAALEFFE